MNREGRRIRVGIAACGLALALLSAPARAVLVVGQPWLRPAQTGQSAELYMFLTSSEGATLVAARADDAAKVVFRGPDKLPRPLDTLLLPARTTIALAPGKAHLALVNLKRSIKLGERVAFALTIRSASGAQQEIFVIAEVRMRSPLEEGVRAQPPQKF
ncbi:MAG TPA: copper chaperone PCu(A)C [Casimicrobiaceae bacterium]|nr:copper chaperone PCu(A)C [Casimicrobiaceae bacterium]